MTGFDTATLYEVMCCGLKAAEELMESNGIPVPERSQVIYHEPVLIPGCCDSLWVAPGDSFNLTERREDCGVVQRSTQFEVSAFRCVTVNNPLEVSACDAAGDCGSLLSCDGEDLPARPDGPCPAGVDTATETLWLMQDRWLLETWLSAAWRKCLCEGWCGDLEGCGNGCRRVRWVGSRRSDGGGCAGTIMTFEVEFP